MNSQARSMLLRGAQELGVTLSDAAVAALDRYAQLLAEWGAQINLTALHSLEDVVQLHFLDSLALVAKLPETEGLRLVDVGSGAGFPGAVCALLRPTWDVTLVERVQKKAAFLMTLRRTLGLGKIKVVAADVSREGGKFDVAVSRAAFPPATWLQVAMPLVEDGRIYAMVAPGDAPATPAGFRLTESLEYSIGGRTRLILGWQRDVPRGTLSPVMTG